MNKQLEKTLQENIAKYKQAGKTDDWLKSYQRKFTNPGETKNARSK
jgi:hypothetical protein